MIWASVIVIYILFELGRTCSNFLIEKHTEHQPRIPNGLPLTEILIEKFIKS